MISTLRLLHRLEVEPLKYPQFETTKSSTQGGRGSGTSDIQYKTTTACYWMKAVWCTLQQLTILFCEFHRPIHIAVRLRPQILKGKKKPYTVMIGWTFEQWCVGLANASEDSENGSEVEEKDSDIPMTTSLCLRFLSELWELFFFLGRGTLRTLSRRCLCWSGGWLTVAIGVRASGCSGDTLLKQIWAGLLGLAPQSWAHGPIFNGIW